MKKRFFILGMLALVLALVGCETTSNGNGNAVSELKVVAEKWRFSNGLWLSPDGVVANAASEIGENTFTVIGDGINISYTGVFTEGGSQGDGKGQWAFLYYDNDKGKKIGIVSDGNNLQAMLGKTHIEVYYDDMDTEGMQDTYSGFARKRR